MIYVVGVKSLYFITYRDFLIKQITWYMLSVYALFTLYQVATLRELSAFCYCKVVFPYFWLSDVIPGNCVFWLTCCNIPLVTLELHQSKVRQRTMFMEFKYVKGCCYAMSEIELPRPRVFWWLHARGIKGG